MPTSRRAPTVATLALLLTLAAPRLPVQACLISVPPGAARVLGTPMWQGESNEAFAWLGRSVRTAGDVNGDGFSDLIVGIPLADGALINSGRAEVYLGSSSGGLAVADWFAEGTGISTIFGAAVSTAGDVNGDGYDDVIVGEPGYSNGEAQEGRAYVYHGSAIGLSPTPAWTVELDVALAEFGSSVSTAGDVNGDGYDDVIVGAPGIGAPGTLFEDQGAAYVYLGSASGLSTAFQAGLVGGQKDSRSGTSVCTAGDVDGDGFADVIIGAPGAENTLGGKQGRAFVHLGSSTGVLLGYAWSPFGTFMSAFGTSVSLAGDTNGDGYGDVVVGAPDHVDGGNAVGAIHVFRGSASGLEAAAARTIVGCQTGMEFGASVCTAGDVNGDGLADVVAGAPLFDRSSQVDNGAYGVYLGSVLATLDPGSSIWDVGLGEGGRMGTSVAAAGDFDGDGFGDVVVGAPLQGLDQEGIARVYPGQPRPPSIDYVLSTYGEQTEAFAGISTSAAGDLNGDGYDDIAVDVSRHDLGGADRGRVKVFYGSPEGPQDPPQILDGENAGDLFGSTLAGAGDVNGDGYDDLLIGAQRYSVGGTDRGRAYCFHGSAAGIVGPPAWTIDGEAASTFLGVVAGAGDVNGDGFADALVAATGWDGTENDQGKAWLYLGSPSGLDTIPIWSFEGDTLVSFLGHVATAGDVNADGFSDILVGVANAGAILGEGVARMFLGGPGGPSTTPDWVVTGGQIGAALQPVAAAGDVNGDGFADVIVGARYFDNDLGGDGIARIYHGNSNGLDLTPTTTLQIVQPNAEYGRDVDTAGDVNGDGYSDVIVGATRYANPEIDEGAWFLYLGSPSGVSTSAVTSVRAGVPGSLLGRSVGSAGDTDGDGLPEVLTGASAWNGSFVDEGRAFVFRGHGTLPAAVLATTARLMTDTADPIAWLGRSSDPVQLSVRGRSAAGRTHVRLEWSMLELGFPHPAAGTLEPWVETGAVDPLLGSSTPLSRVVSLPAEDAPHTWRLRIKGTSPFFPHSPWFTERPTVPSLTAFRSADAVTAVARSSGPDAAPLVRSVAPNPLHAGTTITYAVRVAGPVRADVWDLRGRHVATLVDEWRPAGESRVAWAGRDAAGSIVPPGVYFLSVRTEAGSDRRKITFLR